MIRTKLFLTAACCLQLVMKVCTIPLHGKTKLMPSKDENLFRSELIRRHGRSASPSFSIFLYTRHTNRFVKVTAKNITALAPSKKDKYAELIMTKLGFRGQISLKGKESKKYICMNSLGKVVLKKTYTKPSCMFYNIPHNSGYSTFQSANNPTWYLGFKQNGTVRHGHNTKQHHHAAWMIMRNPDFERK